VKSFIWSIRPSFCMSNYFA